MSISALEFPESKIRHIAERSWWRKIPKRTLAKNSYLTEAEVDKLRSTSEYRNYVEKIMFERRSAEDFETWINKYNYKPYNNMYEAFGARMGLKPEVVQDMVERVRQAHDKIQRK